MEEELVGAVKQDVHYSRRLGEFFVALGHFKPGSDTPTESFRIRKGINGNTDSFSDDLKLKNMHMLHMICRNQKTFYSRVSVELILNFELDAGF